MKKILIQRLIEPSDHDHAALHVGIAIASYLRHDKGACDYVFVRATSAEDVDVGFLRGIDTHAVVVDIELEAPPAVQAEFDYVVTLRPGDAAFQSFTHCCACGGVYGRAPHGQFISCACGYNAPTAPRLPHSRERLGGLLRRVLKYRPFGQPASA